MTFNHLDLLRHLDLYSAEYEKNIIMGGFNTKATQTSIKIFCYSYKLKNHVSNAQKNHHASIYDPGQNISNKIEKSSKIGHGKKSFYVFSNCCCQRLISLPKSEIFLIFPNPLRS